MVTSSRITLKLVSRTWQWYSNVFHSHLNPIQHFWDVLEREIRIMDVQLDKSAATVWCYHVNGPKSYSTLVNRRIKAKGGLTQWPVRIYSILYRPIVGYVSALFPFCLRVPCESGVCVPLHHCRSFRGNEVFYYLTSRNTAVPPLTCVYVKDCNIPLSSLSPSSWCNHFRVTAEVAFNGLEIFQCHTQQWRINFTDAVRKCPECGFSVTGVCSESTLI